MANSAVSARVMAAAENDINRRERGGAFDIDSRLRKISICPPMVGTDRFSGARTCPLQLPLKPVRLLHVGRLVPHKRIEDVIALFHEYNRLEPESCLLLVGNDSSKGYPDYLRDIVSTRFPHLQSNIHFLGEVPQAILKSAYNEASAFLTMSEHEGFCLPLVEAMSFGLPIFAYAEPAVMETLGGSGKVFQSKDFPVMAAEIHRVLHDPSEREHMIVRQRGRLEEIAAQADGRCIWMAMREVLFVD
jgi:glycosyltransferase involved in cell wall biosynthesis